MKNEEKDELRRLARRGLSFKQIRSRVYCSDATIRQYIKIFQKELEEGGR